ncbi:hypothetical protein Q5752_004544 [Cryptotrichosporon argae]
MSPVKVPAPVKVAIVGAGQRGAIYAKYILEHPDEAVVVAVADPKPYRRKALATAFSLAPENVHADWRGILDAPRVADAVVIATLDDSHAALVHEFAAAKYDILCEKPLATSVDDCVSIYRDVTDASVVFGVGHVLRYSPFNVAVKEVIDSGALGQIINIQHIEPIGFNHFVHSYVRGNWSKEAETSFSLMTKCCHDLDILAFYLGGARNPATKVSSFGSLSHFRPAAKPAEAGAATRCLDCAHERQCAYSAVKSYLDPIKGELVAQKENRAKHFVEAAVLDIENVTDALNKTKYGECVYNGNNDVVDHQVVNIQYADGATASLTMSAFTEAECARSTVIHGTKGELIGDMLTFTVFDFNTRTKVLHTPARPQGGHGGGDAGLSAAFWQAAARGSQDPLGVSPLEMLQSHLLVFAAEQSRLTGDTVDLASFSELCT